MITSYAEAYASWDEWQKAYRFGVLLIFPPEGLRTAVNRLRARFDPRSQAYCDAHISVTVPLPHPLSEQDWKSLEQIAGGIEPFELEVGPLEHFLPHPGVVLAVRPFEPLEALRSALESSSPFGRAQPRRWPYRPHMTIAEFISRDRTLELMGMLENRAPSGAFLCDSVTYAVPDDAFHFTGRRVLTLGQRGQAL